MQDESYRPRQLPIPRVDKQHSAQPIIFEAWRCRAARLRRYADQAMKFGCWDTAGWLEEQGLVAEHRVGLIAVRLVEPSCRNATQ